MTASGVFSSWDTLAIKSVRSVSVPASSSAILLKQAMISLNRFSPTGLGMGRSLTEKSPRIIHWAPSVICLTGRSMVILRRMLSMTVQARLSSITLPKVSLAARLTFSSVSARSMRAARALKKSIIQQVMTKAISRKKSR